MKKRKEDLKELVLYTVFGNMTFIISIASYAVFNVALGINELIANALAWVFAVLFRILPTKDGYFAYQHLQKQQHLCRCLRFSVADFTLIIEETIIFVFITMLSYPSMWVKLAAQVVVVVLNYIISKLFVFKNQ